MSATGNSKRRHAAFLAVGLLLLITLAPVPAIYFCPEMGALPSPCCTREAPDGLGGGCCRFIGMDQAGALSAALTLPPALPAGDYETPWIITPPVPEAAVPDRLSRHRDPDRPAPPSLHILLSTFLC